MEFFAGLPLDQSPRDVLGIGPNATVDEVRAAYKKRALETHPDKGGDPDKFRQVRNAYEALKTAGVVAGGAGAKLSKPFPSRQQAARQAAQSKVPWSPPSPRGSKRVFQGQAPTLAVPKKRRKTIEEDIAAGFNQIPLLSREACRARAAERVGNVNATMNRIRAMPIDQVWEQMIKVSQTEREKVIGSLPPDIKTNLKHFLKAKKQQREGPSIVQGTAAEAVKGGPDSSSSSSSSSSGSSSSTTSSETGDVTKSTANPGAMANASGKWPWERDSGEHGGIAPPARSTDAAANGRGCTTTGKSARAPARRFPAGMLKREVPVCPTPGLPN